MTMRLLTLRKERGMVRWGFTWFRGFLMGRVHERGHVRTPTSGRIDRSAMAWDSQLFGVWKWGRIEQSVGQDEEPISQRLTILTHLSLRPSL